MFNGRTATGRWLRHNSEHNHHDGSCHYPGTHPFFINLDDGCGGEHHGCAAAPAY